MLSDLLYVSSKAVLVLLGLFPVAYALIAWRSGGKVAQVRLAYFGYAGSALAFAFFQLEIYSNGGIALMMIGVFLVPIVIAGTLAIGNTIGARNTTLRVLAGATVAAVLLLGITGMWGVALVFTIAATHAYQLLVLAACIYRRAEWLPRRKSQ
jgi:hypothetical protein